MKKVVSLLSVLIFTLSAFAEEKITNEMIYLKLIEIEKDLKVLKAEFKQFKEDTNKRFEELRDDMNRRFELMQIQIDKRFEQIDKRFEQIDKRFEQIDKRFEEVNKRFEDMFTFLWIITGIFTTLTLGVIGFAFWDRRTIIRKAKEETIETLEREGKLRNLIEALRELAKEDKKLAEVLRQYNLL
ncbi:MAG: hypothetical protein GXO45_01080 [Aquificae bacterium]|nr:hypothetical protein [Aquificota bacterium]